MTTWDDFLNLELRVGTVVRVEPFPQARKPAYKLFIDLGELGMKASSAQITERYAPADLVGRQVVCVTGLPPKRIGPFVSEVLVTGVSTESGVVLLGVDAAVANGRREV